MQYTIYFNAQRIVLSSKDHTVDLHDNDMILYNPDRESLSDAVQFAVNGRFRTIWLLCDDVEAIYRVFSSLFHEVDAGGGVVSNDDGMYLVIYRNGYWDLPKGKREPGESIEDTAVREVCEECGIEIPELGEYVCTTHHTYKMEGRFVLKHTYWYRMHLRGDYSKVKPQREEGITQIRWVRDSELEDYSSYAWPSVSMVFSHVKDSF